MTVGVVSALNRSISNNSYDRYGRRMTVTNTMIQVDADINSGNSGGGMFSVTGELMGVPTIKYSSNSFSGASIDGINLCIPINEVKPLIERALNQNGRPAEQQQPAGQDSAASGNDLIGRPRLGVTIAELNSNSYAVRSGIIPSGVYVREVEAGSPAAAAGMAVGDIVVEADGTVISTVSQLQSVIAGHGEGDTMTLRVYRAEGMANAIENGGTPPGRCTAMWTASMSN